MIIKLLESDIKHALELYLKEHQLKRNLDDTEIVFHERGRNGDTRPSDVRSISFELPDKEEGPPF